MVNCKIASLSFQTNRQRDNILGGHKVLFGFNHFRDPNVSKDTSFTIILC